MVPYLFLLDVCLIVLFQVALESPNLPTSEALALVSTNIEKLLGISSSSAHADIVAYRGGSVFDFSSRPIAVISPSQGIVELWR